jgi:DnaA family protein
VNKPKQLIFPFQIDQKASFDSFFCSPDNQNLMTRLADIVISQDANELIIHGEEGSGKSFLMQAICNELSSAEKQFAFIPMKKAFNMGVEIFQNLGSLDVVCIDDVQLIFKTQDWETALFNLINECQQSNCSLMLSLGGTQPLEESVVLPDLLSRIKRMEFVALHAVKDESFNQAIDFVAQQLDISIEKAELDFLLKHQIRKFSLLVENIIALDKQAASQKRKITIPLIKEALNIK